MLETKRLMLKMPNPRQAAKVADYYKRNAEFLEKWEPKRNEEFYSLKYHFFDLKNQKDRFCNDEEYRFWIFKKDTWDLIGSVTINCIIWGNFKSCFMSYKLDAAEVNKGYVTEACEKVLNFVFEIAGLHRVEINMVTGNYASIRVAEKLGFAKEGMSPKFLEINGEWMDHYRYAKINEED